MSSLVGEQSPDARPHAIIIGSGFGGLAAAIRLGARGYRVTVLERLDKFGGRAYQHKQDGFIFDAGPTIITGRYLLDELWQMAGRRVADDLDLRPMEPFYRIRFNDGSHFDCFSDSALMHREIARFAPHEVANFDRFMAMSERIYRFGFEQLGSIPFDAFGKMAAAVPELLRLKAYRTVYGLVSQYFQDERLRIVFSFHPLLIGGSPFRAPSTYCLITYLEKTWGVQFAMGGMHSLVAGMVKLVCATGGQLFNGAEVGQILVDGGVAKGVELADGRIIEADIVVSNADAAMTYQKLVPRRWRKRWSDRKLKSMHYSMSVFVWYFGTKRRYDDVLHHTIALGPRYRGHLKEMFGKKSLAEDFSLYLYRPTATDRSMAPDGCDSFYALSPVPHLDSGTDWTVEAEPYRAKIERFLSARLLPGLGDQIVTQRCLTPLDFAERLSSYKGAAFGFEPLAQQAGWFRPHNKSEDITNLFLVGAGTHPGGGIPGVIASARVLDHVVPDASRFAKRGVEGRDAA